MYRTRNLTYIALISLTRHPRKVCDESTNTDTTLSWLRRRIEPISVQASWLPLNEQNQNSKQKNRKKTNKTFNTLALPATFASTFTTATFASILHFLVTLGINNARSTASSRLTDQRPLKSTFLVHASQVSMTGIH